MLYAARECARVVLQEGLDRGIARHRLASRALRAGLTAMGLRLFGDAEHRMANVTGVIIPQEIANGEAVRGQLLQDFGIEIGTSFGPLAGKIWRIGTMGYVCRKANVLRCLTALEAVGGTQWTVARTPSDWWPDGVPPVPLPVMLAPIIPLSRKQSRNLPVEHVSPGCGQSPLVAQPRNVSAGPQNCSKGPVAHVPSLPTSGLQMLSSH